jgi:signal transduction histidine kinase
MTRKIHQLMDFRNHHHNIGGLVNGIALSVSCIEDKNETIESIKHACADIIKEYQNFSNNLNTNHKKDFVERSNILSDNLNNVTNLLNNIIGDFKNLDFKVIKLDTDLNDLKLLRSFCTTLNARITDLLNFSDEYEHVKLNEIISSAITITQRTYADVQFFTSIISDSPIRVNRVRFDQVFENLFCNSAKKKNTACIFIEIKDNYSRKYKTIKVIDDGPGISHELLPSLFLEKDTISGLGLPFVKTVIDHHKGVIAADNDPKRGARFIIEIPLQIMSD